MSDEVIYIKKIFVICISFVQLAVKVTGCWIFFQ